MPVSLTSTLYLFTYEKFDLDRSMVFGTFVFETKRPIEGFGFEAKGAALQDAILLKRTSDRAQSTEAHELVHVYQNESVAGLNMFFNRPLEKLKKNNKYFRLYDKIFYTDFHTMLRRGIYTFERQTYGYRAVSFEKEARYFSQ